MNNLLLKYEKNILFEILNDNKNNIICSNLKFIGIKIKFTVNDITYNKVSYIYFFRFRELVHLVKNEIKIKVLQIGKTLVLIPELYRN